KAAVHTARFLDFLPDDLHEIQELFTRSFDVQAITTLDIGYVMFGDDYKRGELLVNMSREHAEAGNPCGGELPDYLPNVLRLLPRLKDRDLARDLARELVFPAVRKMISEFDPARLQTKKDSYIKHYKTLIDVNETRETLYVHCLNALAEVLVRDFGLKEEEEVSRPSSDFLRSVAREMEIEASAQGVS
ncbi:MAG: hypothetical protein HUU37_07100, partial [Bdellovibrionales bacterium]|nr:hypothetical protein [Bdellovibrionales bacterium]